MLIIVLIANNNANNTNTNNNQLFSGKKKDKMREFVILTTVGGKNIQRNYTWILLDRWYGNSEEKWCKYRWVKLNW